MSTLVTPIQQAITGNEYNGSASEPQMALAQFYRALNTRDFALMQQNWSSSDDAAMDNPLGGIKRGWQEIRSVYQRLFSSPSEYHFEFFDYTLHISGDLFYAVGRERGYLHNEKISMPLAIRTTRIFRREHGVWKQIHHHGSIEDTKMLDDYREAVA